MMMTEGGGGMSELYLNHSWYKISKKSMKCIGSKLNKPDKLHDARVFYVPDIIWYQMMAEWNPDGYEAKVFNEWRGERSEYA